LITLKQICINFISMYRSSWEQRQINPEEYKNLNQKDAVAKLLEFA
jgi:hypothetical protein